jgi:DNA-binding NarL/FixJ family response regulator
MPKLKEILSPRQLDVIALMAQGFGNKEIAQHLKISLSTVKVNAAFIYAKTGLNRLQIVAKFTRESLSS